MPTISMNVTLPGNLKAFMDRRVAERGYESHSEYVRDLVRKDEVEGAKEQLRALIAAGLSSPPGKPWSELRDDLLRGLPSREL